MLGLAGCARFSPGDGLSEVRKIAGPALPTGEVGALRGEEDGVGANGGGAVVEGAVDGGRHGAHRPPQRPRPPGLRGAEQGYMQAVNRLAAAAVDVRSQARDAYQAYRADYDVARRYQRDVLPLRKLIAEETLLRFNAMQIDVFALLVEARQRIASTLAAIDAERDFWLRPL